jgi:hypothetical protein
MAEELFKICLAGVSTEPVAGTESLTTMDLINAWLNENQEFYAESDPARPNGQGSKYIVLPHDM